MSRRDWLELVAHFALIGACLLGLAAVGLEWL